ncbi:hypothetical protein D3C80_1977540 [compost metagenome]
MGSTDHGHGAPIAVAKGGWFFITDNSGSNDLGHVSPLLFRHRGKSWKRAATFTAEAGNIANREDVRMTGHRAVF